MSTDSITAPTERQPRSASPLRGVCTFYHGGKKGRPISIEVKDAAAKTKLLNDLMNDKEVEGFVIHWEATDQHG